MPVVDRRSTPLASHHSKGRFGPLFIARYKKIHMYQYNLLKSQKNQVFEIIKSSGLDPFNFKWTTTDSMIEEDTKVPVLEYEDGEFYFQFDLKNESKYSGFSPGKEGVDETSYPGTWEFQLHNVTEWLTYLENEIDQPDLWSEIEKYRIEEDQDVLSQIVNEPFTVNQADQVQIGILKVRSYLEQYTKTNQEQADFVNHQLDYLIEAVKRQGKRDWLHTSIGVIMTITTALALAPDEAKNIWNILKTALGGILQLPQ
ncbi:MAG: hypothetical protein BMS9Abin11_0683 [Gammaproteobacteria bacterium]|nr:MAG: hypothetical protein BMS9Abin11_0683 [Gammaproteobacteria bacterium]